MRAILPTSIVLTALCLPHPTQADPRGSEPTIEVIGNTRTDRDVIVSAANLADGMADPAALAEARQRVFNLRLFETVDVTTRDGETATPVITIRVKERWTLFPVPFVSTSARGTKAGLVVLESNLFGHNKLIAAGGSYASWGSSAFALYIDPSLGGTRAVLRASASYTTDVRERRLGDAVTFQDHDARVDLALLAGYRVTDRLSLLAGGFATRVAARPEMPYPGIASTSTVVGWAASLEYRGADFQVYYDDGLTASVKYKQARHALGADRDLLDVLARAQYTRALIPGQATSLTAQVDVVNGDPTLDVHLLGGRVGTRGFELQTLWVDRAATLTLDHQIPVLRFPWGIWTIDGFVDAGYAALGDHHDSFVTPGAGLRLYLPRVAFPALGVDVAYATDTEKLLVMAAVGGAF